MTMNLNEKTEDSIENGNEFPNQLNPNIQKKSGGEFLTTIKILGAIMVIYLILLAMCDSNNKPKEQDNNLLSAVYTEGYVEKMLKSPSTAEFGLADVTEINKNKFHVENYVDSQNSFGAVIRLYYECDIEFNGKNYEITNFESYDTN